MKEVALLLSKAIFSIVLWIPFFLIIPRSLLLRLSNGLFSSAYQHGPISPVFEVPSDKPTSHWSANLITFKANFYDFANIFLFILQFLIIQDPWPPCYQTACYLLWFYPIIPLSSFQHRWLTPILETLSPLPCFHTFLVFLSIFGPSLNVKFLFPLVFFFNHMWIYQTMYSTSLLAWLIGIANLTGPKQNCWFPVSFQRYPSQFSMS